MMIMMMIMEIKIIKILCKSELISSSRKSIKQIQNKLCCVTFDSQEHMINKQLFRFPFIPLVEPNFLKKQLCLCLTGKRQRCKRQL